MKTLIYAALPAMGVLVAISLAAPQPSIVHEPGDWTLDVDFDLPRQLVVRIGPKHEVRRYWYMIITLTNRTGQDADFYPRCELMTDTFQVLPADRNIPLQVFSKIAQRHHSAYPFLESLEETPNKILQGTDNTRDIAIIWSDFDHNANSIKLFIEGLSNETAVVEHPVEKNEQGIPKKLYLRKTLQLDYELGGDPAYRSKTRLLYKGKRWVMR